MFSEQGGASIYRGQYGCYQDEDQMPCLPHSVCFANHPGELAMLSRTSSRSSSSVISSSSTEELVERTSEKQIRLPTVVSLASSSTKKSDSSTSNQENLL